MKYIDADKLLAEIERRKADAKLYDMSGGDAPIYDELLSIITSLQQEQSFPRWIHANYSDKPEIRYTPSGTPYLQNGSYMIWLSDLDTLPKDGKDLTNPIQEQPEGLHFTPLNRLIQIIPSKNWNETVNNYAKKLRDCLIKEGYLKDAEVLQGYISYMNGNNVPMATMDKQEQPEIPSNLDEAAVEQANLIYPENIRMGHVAKHDVNLLTRRGFIKGFKAGAEWMAGQGVTKEAVIGMATEEISINVSEQTLDELDLCPGDKVVVQIRKK